MRPLLAARCLAAAAAVCLLRAAAAPAAGGSTRGHGEACPLEADDACSAEGSIYFIHSSGERGVPPPVARCAIESAARQNPEKTVWVLSDGWSLAALHGKFPNVKHRPLEPERTLSVHSGLLEWFSAGEWRAGHRFHHLSDSMRLALVLGCGGTYLDTDFISVAPIPAMEPGAFTLGFEDAIDGTEDRTMCNAVLSTPRPGHPFARALVDEFVQTFDAAANFGWNGPQLLGRAWRDNEQIRESVVRAPPARFYPLPWFHTAKLFDHGPAELEKLLRRGPGEAVGVHLWQSQVRAQLKFIGSDYAESTLVGSLFSRACPDTWKWLSVPAQSRLSKSQARIRIIQPGSGRQFSSVELQRSKAHRVKGGQPGVEDQVQREEEAGVLIQAVVEGPGHVLDDLHLCMTADGAPVGHCQPVLNSEPDKVYAQLAVNLGPGHHLVTCELCKKMGHGDPSGPVGATICDKHALGQTEYRRAHVSFTIDFHSLAGAAAHVDMVAKSAHGS